MTSSPIKWDITRNPWTVLGFQLGTYPTLSEIHTNWKERILKAHPDKADKTKGDGKDTPDAAVELLMAKEILSSKDHMRVLFLEYRKWKKGPTNNKRLAPHPRTTYDHMLLDLYKQQMASLQKEQEELIKKQIKEEKELKDENAKIENERQQKLTKLQDQLAEAEATAERKLSIVLSTGSCAETPSGSSLVPTAPFSATSAAAAAAAMVDSQEELTIPKETINLFASSPVLPTAPPPSPAPDKSCHYDSSYQTERKKDDLCVYCGFKNVQHDYFDPADKPKRQTQGGTGFDQQKKEQQKKDLWPARQTVPFIPGQTYDQQLNWVSSVYAKCILVYYLLRSQARSTWNCFRDSCCLRCLFARFVPPHLQPY
jgi:hypothetical protein